VYTDQFLAWALKSNKLKIYHPKRKAPHTVPKKVKEEKPMMSLCAKANAFFTLCYLQLGGDHKFTEPFRFAQMCQPNNVFSLNNSLIFRVYRISKEFHTQMPTGEARGSHWPAVNWAYTGKKGAF